MFMAKKSTYKSFANNFAEHSESNLSWLHPHLAQDCRAMGTNTITLDVGGEKIFPDGFIASSESRLAASNWRTRFVEMALKNKLDFDEIKSAKVTFTFADDSDYAYGAAVQVELQLRDGTTFVEQPFVFTPKDPKKMIPGTNVPWPDEYVDRNAL